MTEQVDRSALRLGKRAAKYDAKRLRLARYLPIRLPEPPVMVDFGMGRLDWQMYLNDSIGDCTIAACAHQVQQWWMNLNFAADPGIADADVLALYESWNGYNPADPSTDRGGYEVDVLNRWRSDGFKGHKLIAYADPNVQDIVHIKQAISLFGGLYIGLTLPVSAQFQLIWDVVADDGGIWGGHAVNVAGYDAQYISIVTWGAIQKMTWPFFLRYCDEAHVLFSEDWLGHFGGDSVVDMAALQNDLAALSG